MQLAVNAAFFANPSSIEDLLQLSQHPFVQKGNFHILGGGSNTLFTTDFNGLIIHPEFMGVKCLERHNTFALFKLGCSENWHQFVASSVEGGFFGQENLASIPGTVGAAPVQNIAAYGQSQADTFYSLDYFDFAKRSLTTMNVAKMQFAYRDSLLKHYPYNRGLVVSVTYKLNQQTQINDSYYSIGRRHDSITSKIKKLGISNPTPKDIFSIVSAIRQEKLPDWTITPTFGSFFKNPLVSQTKLKELQAEISELQIYPPDNLTYKQQTDPLFDQSEMLKIPVGRLLDSLGWSDRRLGHVYTYNHWASIITHDGNATGPEVLEFTNQMAQDVQDHYGLKLESEVVVV